MSKCSQTHPATYNNYGSYLRSRGYDKEICNLIFDIQNGNIPLKKITVDPGIGKLTLTRLNITTTGSYSNLTVAGVQRFTGLDVSGEAVIKGPLNILGSDSGAGNYNFYVERANINNLNIGTSITMPKGTITSSLRYKNNVNNMDLSQAKKLLKIDAVNFEYKHIPGIPQIGVIAEHLHENDLKEYVTYNEKNEPDAVNYIGMISPLIEIVKDLTNRIEALESINATLQKN